MLVEASRACAATLAATSAFRRASFQGLIPTETFLWGCAAFAPPATLFFASFAGEFASKSPLKARTFCRVTQKKFTWSIKETDLGTEVCYNVLKVACSQEKFTILWINMYFHTCWCSTNMRGGVQKTPLCRPRAPAELYSLTPVAFELAGDEVKLLNPSPSAVSCSKPCSLTARM